MTVGRAPADIVSGVGGGGDDVDRGDYPLITTRPAYHTRRRRKWFGMTTST